MPMPTPSGVPMAMGLPLYDEATDTPRTTLDRPRQTAWSRTDVENIEVQFQRVKPSHIVPESP